MQNLEFRIIENITDVGTRIHWDRCAQCVYYVDVPNSYIHKYIPSEDIATKGKVGLEPFAFAFPVKDVKNQFIGGLGRKFILFNWDGKARVVSIIKEIGEIETEPEYCENRLNGAKVDPCGRLWAGTMGPTGPDGDTLPGRGALYSVDKDTITKHVDNIGISNGLAWDLDAGKMYFVDTLDPKIFSFDYDQETGSICNRQVVYEFIDEIVRFPDGLTIDTDGNLWVAMIFASKILKIDPRTSELLYTVNMQTTQITALSFGDKNYETLYVNTAQMPVKGKKPEYPAGCLFTIKNLGVRGLPGDYYVKAVDDITGESEPSEEPAPTLHRTK